MPRVRIPTPLRSYTNNEAWAYAAGSTLDEVLHALDATYPGIRFRAIDEQGQIRKHMRIFVNDEIARALSTAVGEADEVTLMQALSGG